MRYKLTAANKSIFTRINLPASKSISNRVLIINALCNNPFPVKNLSDSDDTKVMQQALDSDENKFDIGHAGTAMRFLTAYLANKPGTWEITGSERMKQRPATILVDALRALGAQIEYTENEGFPPLKITGRELTGKTIELNGSISSQYISALLMIAPVLKNGLTLKLTGYVTSLPYIELTLKLMEQFGISYSRKENIITVPAQNYIPAKFTVESDWSGASYWYEILALTENGEIMLKNLKLDSLQGDSAISGWFEQFGISSQQTGDDVLLSKTEVIQPKSINIDFIDNPDIAQTFACLCVAKKIPFHFSGLKTLKIKETDRIAALQNELAKFGATLTEPAEGELAWNGILSKPANIPVVKTYDDHRMALSFAPMALAGYTIEIEDPDVVTKSYPGFWKDLKKAGFNITVL